MTNARYTDFKSKLTQWLLRVTLIFAIFTVSGYAGNSEPIQQKGVQTELVISGNYKASKRTISYIKAFKLIRYNDQLTSTCNSWINTLFTYNILTEVKFNSISRQFYSHRSASRFLPVKTIPQSTDEDIFVNLG